MASNPIVISIKTKNVSITGARVKPNCFLFNKRIPVAKIAGSIIARSSTCTPLVGNPTSITLLGIELNKIAGTISANHKI